MSKPWSHEPNSVASYVADDASFFFFFFLLDFVPLNSTSSPRARAALRRLPCCCFVFAVFLVAVTVAALL